MKPSSRARLLLLELVFDFLIFAVCAVICAALLVQSRKISMHSSAFTQAVYLAQSAAELWKVGITPETEHGNYTLSITDEQTENGVRTCTITVFCDGEALYSLEGVAAA